MRIRAVLTLVLALVAVTAQATSAQAATVVAAWRMDDPGSTMVDSSGNNATGKLVNVATGQTGTIGAAYGFSGKPSYVTVPDNNVLDPGTRIFTVSLKVKFRSVPSSSVGDYDLIRKGLSTTSGGDWKLEITSTGAAYCLFKGSAGQVSMTRGPNLANNTWHSISCTRSGSTVKLTVDGTAYSKSGATGTIANSSATLLGAKSTSGADQYTGLMDEVTVSTG